MSTVTERKDPTYAIKDGAPEPSADIGKFIETQKDSCGLIISGINAVIEKITGWSLLETIYKPLCGDYNTIDSMRQAWPKVADSIRLVNDNYSGLKDDTPTVWTGQGAEAAMKRLQTMIDYHEHQAKGCDLLGDQLGNVLEVSKAAVEVVSLGLSLLDSLAEDAISDAAVPVIGWAKGLVTAPRDITKAVSTIRKCVKAINSIRDLLLKLPKVTRTVSVVLKTTDEAVNFANTVISIDGGKDMDNTANTAFGT